jgi:hypothetical protein
MPQYLEHEGIEKVVAHDLIKLLELCKCIDVQFLTILSSGVLASGFSFYKFHS